MAHSIVHNKNNDDDGDNDTKRERNENQRILNFEMVVINRIAIYKRISRTDSHS